MLRKFPRLAFPPGVKYAYSNLSYWLLGAVIEAVSGQSYCDYMRHHVFEPLGASPQELNCLISVPPSMPTATRKSMRWRVCSFMS